MVAIRAVCFDAFGTLCRIREPRRPYRRLFERTGADPGRAARLAMTTRMGFAELAAALSSGPVAAMDGLVADLEAELASVELFDDAGPALAGLAAAGLGLWVASNLAPPYAGPLRRLLDGRVGGYSLSFEIGAAKPEPAVFAHACDGLALPPGEVLMVGDGPRSDVAGARAFGMPAVLLARGGPGAWPESIASLRELPGRAQPGAGT